MLRLMRLVRPPSVSSPLSDIPTQDYKFRLVRAVRPASARSPLSNIPTQDCKLRLVMRAVRPPSVSKPVLFDTRAYSSKLKSVRAVRLASARTTT